jgi:hypothetical protein
MAEEQEQEVAIDTNEPRVKIKKWNAVALWAWSKYYTVYCV